MRRTVRRSGSYELSSNAATCECECECGCGCERECECERERERERERECGCVSVNVSVSANARLVRGQAVLAVDPNDHVAGEELAVRRHRCTCEREVECGCV